MPNVEYQRRIDAVNQIRQKQNLPPVTWRCKAAGLEFHFNGTWFGCNDASALTTLERYPCWERQAA